jgi:hypothetical protein
VEFFLRRARATNYEQLHTVVMDQVLEAGRQFADRVRDAILAFLHVRVGGQGLRKLKKNIKK